MHIAPPLQGQPHPPPHVAGRRRRWPVVAAIVVGAVTGVVAAVVIVMQMRPGPAAVPPAAHPATVTVPAPTPAKPAPLPTEQANRQTCDQGLTPAERFIDEAQAALDTLPNGVKINQPEVLANPAWNAAVQRAAAAYQRASDTLKAAIAPGTTPMLAEAAATGVKALHLLATSNSTGDPMTGNAVAMANETARMLGTLCERYAP